MNDNNSKYFTKKNTSLTNNYHINYIFDETPLMFDNIRLYQVGRMFCNETTIIDDHLHTNFFELTIVTEGKGVITTNNINTEVQKGDIYFSFPFDTHKITSNQTEPLKYDFFSFTTFDSEQKDKLTSIQQTFKYPKLRCFQNEFIIKLVNRIINELATPSILSKQIITSLLNLVILYSINNFSNISLPTKYSLQAPDILCYRVMNYIDTHLNTIKTLEQVSDRFNYNYSYLSTLFKKTTNVSLTEYCTKKRFDYAKQLLIDGNKIYEVANTLNYSNQYAFSKSFKKYFGISPKQFQLLHLSHTPPPAQNPLNQ